MMRKIFSVLLLIPTLALASPSSSALKLRLAGGEIGPAAGSPAAPGWFQADRVATGTRGLRYVVAITTGPIGPEQRQRIESSGAEILGYLPNNGYRLRAPAQALASIQALPFIGWMGELPPHMKVQPELSQAIAAAGGSTRLRAVLAPGESHLRVLAALEGLVSTSSPSGMDGAWRVSATVPGQRLPAVLSAISALPEVEAVEPVRRIVPLNQDGVWVHQSFVGPSPQETPVFDQGIFGCDQVVSVADTGQDHDTCYFRDTVHGPPPVFTCITPPCPVETPDLNQRKDIIYYDWSPDATGEEDTCPTLLLGGSGHGTHTSGSAAGDNTPYADCAGYTSANRNGGDGQAPGAKLVMLELGDGLEYLNDLGGTIWNIADVAYRSGARIHSFSFGGVCHDALGQCVPGCTLPYDSLARDADLAMWTYPDLLLVNAAGNAGLYCPPPDAVVTPALAKSILATGGTEHGVSAGSIMPESSPGPVFDGRLRPSVVAQGRSVVSAASDANLVTNNCSTCSLDGSSMAAPTVAGLAALVREYYTAGFYATGARNPGQGLVPSGALIKATIIDGAVDTAAPGADFESGFGRVLLGSTLSFSGDPFRLVVDDHRDGITTGSVVNHAFDVTGTEPLQATLVWTDYPADLNAAVARVNELKLEVIDPAGNVWFQTLDGSTGAPVQTSDSGLPHDSLNTEERIVFAAPAAGRWAVRVVGVDVPWGPQPFALVIRGDMTDCPAPAAPGAPVLTTPADRQVNISWNPVSGAAAYNVYRSFGACPGGPWVPVATSLPSTSFLDSTVSGGVTYSYQVTAASDADGYCESPPSPCDAAVPTGECTLPPMFRGITSAVSAGTAGCATTLEWNAGTPVCAGDLVYNIYRSTDPDFQPSPANHIAACVAGTSYTDTDNLVHGTRYHYRVRAEDGTGGHGGPCRGGNEDRNLAGADVRPFGPPELGTWDDDAGDTGAAEFDLGPAWQIDPTGGDTAPGVYKVESSQLACTDLTSPVLSLADPGQGPQLTFSTIHNLDYDPAFILFYEGSIGQVEIASGPSFTNWTRLPLSPDYPTYIDGPYYVCDSTLPGTNYFSDIDMVYDTYTASLVNWGGQDVKIRFHLSGDLYFYGGNWWIDDVQVTQVTVPGSCTTSASGPPPVPDGASVPGAPLLVGKSGTDLVLTWDGTTCPATEVNVYRGGIGDYTTFTAGDCGLPASGAATLAIPDDSWFLVVATDGANTDGSWSRDGSGAELNYSGASAACLSITDHVPGGVCP